MALKQCIDCGQLSPKTRCPTCRSAKEQQRAATRGNTTQRGLGWEYQQARKTLLADHPACVYCGEPADTADHDTPRSEGGTNHPENLLPACAHCNYSRGGKTAGQQG